MRHERPDHPRQKLDYLRGPGWLEFAGPIARRRRRAILVLAACAALIAAIPAGASAATSSSTADGNGQATNYGFRCDATYNWLHQNWPNISVRTSSNQNVYTRSSLYEYLYTPPSSRKRKHHRRRKRIPGHWDWTLISTSQWYVGVSNVTGRKQLGYTAGGLPYYFAIPGQPSTVPANDGYQFLHLTDGLYTTLEQYSWPAGGEQWSSWSRSMWDSVTDSCAV